MKSLLIVAALLIAAFSWGQAVTPLAPPGDPPPSAMAPKTNAPPPKVAAPKKRAAPEKLLWAGPPTVYEPLKTKAGMAVSVPYFLEKSGSKTLAFRRAGEWVRAKTEEDRRRSITNALAIAQRAEDWSKKRAK